MTLALTLFGLVSIAAAIYAAIKFVPIVEAFSAFVDKVAKNYASN